MKQGSQEWLDFRKNKIGASDAPVIMGVSPWKKPLTLWEEKMGLKKEKVNSYFMQRGLHLEASARLYFNAMMGLNTQPDMSINFNYPWMIASLDGYDPNKNVAVEIKCPGKEDHKLALQGKIPEKYYPQLQHQMAVMELNSIYYLSFDGKSGPIIHVNRNQYYIDQMIKKEEKFYQCLIDFSPFILQ